MKTITVSELHEVFKKLGSNELILDVRHVPGSKNISHELVGSHTGELKKFAAVYVYCRSGGRVGHACSTLASLGLTNLVAVAGGGMPDWIQAGFPVEK
jgi:rhodanese-related sulfurtransferase